MQLDFLNLERLPETLEDLIEGTRNPEVVLDLNRRLNAQADRLEALFTEILNSPDHKPIEYKDIMHWKARADYLRSIGQLKKAKALEKAEALKEAKEADEDEEFMEGYKDFLANEFNES